MTPECAPPRVVDVSTGQIVGETPPDFDLAAIAPEDTLFGQANEGTGLRSSAGELSSNTLGQLPGAVGRFFTFDDIVKARQDFATASQSMLQSFVVNPKFLIGEVNRIRDEIGAASGAFTSPNSMRIKLRALDRFLRRKVQLQNRFAADTGLPSDERAAAAQNARSIAEFLDLMGVPQGDGESEVIDLRNPEPLEEALPQAAVDDGVTENEWRLMPPEDRALWQN